MLVNDMSCAVVENSNGKYEFYLKYFELLFDEKKFLVMEFNIEFLLSSIPTVDKAYMEHRYLLVLKLYLNI